MSKPEITEQINGYKFSWVDEHLDISITRLRIHSSDDRVTGEILITSSLVDNKPIHPQTSFNFTSDRTRSGLIKTLTEAYQEWDWQTIINQLCLAVVDRARTGEPVEELDTAGEVNRPHYLLEPILFERQPTIIFGEKGVTKSTLALVFITCLLLPWHDNPLGLIVPNKSIKTLLLDYETEKEIVEWNLKCLQKGMDLPDFKSPYRRCKLPLAMEVDSLMEHKTKIGAEVLIIDSLGASAGGDLKDAQSALTFFSALRQLKCTSLILGQTSKDQETKKRSVYGSTFFSYYARSVWELRKHQEENENEISIALYHQWCNLSRLHSPLGFRITFGDDTTTIEKKSITAPELIERMGTQARMLNLLKMGAMSPQEIMDELNISRGSLDMASKRLRDKKKIIKVGEKWGLLIQEDLL